MTHGKNVGNDKSGSGIHVASSVIRKTLPWRAAWCWGTGTLLRDSRLSLHGICSIHV